MWRDGMLKDVAYAHKSGCNEEHLFTGAYMN